MSENVYKNGSLVQTAGAIKTDTALDKNSENPVQNKIITENFDNINQSLSVKMDKSWKSLGVMTITKNITFEIPSDATEIAFISTDTTQSGFNFSGFIVNGAFQLSQIWYNSTANSIYYGSLMGTISDTTATITSFLFSSSYTASQRSITMNVYYR